MSFRIATNLASLGAQRALGRSQLRIDHSLKALASGSRIVDAGDDAAGFAISENLRGQISGVQQARSNALNATSLIQVAEGGLNEQNNLLIRLRELAVYAASDTVGETEREYLDEEFQQLVEENERIAQSTRFGQKKLLVGAGDRYEFHVGAFNGPENIVSFKLNTDTSSNALGISDLSVSSKSEARDALEQLDESLSQIGQARASFGAMQSRLQFTADHLSVQNENLQVARSNIVDTDYAEEVTTLTQSSILQETGISVLAQANQNASRVLRLLA